MNPQPSPSGRAPTRECRGDGRVTPAAEGRGVALWGSGQRRAGRRSERLRGGEEESGEGGSVHSMSGHKKTAVFVDSPHT